MRQWLLCALFATSIAIKWHDFHSYEYFFSDKYENSYDGVAAACAKEGATLVIIKTEEIQSFVWSLTTHLGKILHNLTQHSH